MANNIFVELIEWSKALAGALKLCHSVEMLPNSVTVTELAAKKGATILLMPIFARRQLFDLLDELAIKIRIEFYSDSPDALLKAVVE